LAHDDGEEGFGVVPYSSESEWSDEDVVLTAFGDVELQVTGTSRAEGALTVAAHRFATIDKGNKKSK
jgi:phospho-N-acetylmuramoyl-pentapeptide-transferase